ncbi:hypothetical protein [Rhizobium sp. FKL33]|uniref:hypothetical protein n=1 Tax=Rhizobium sp. FKL33 TaxID=2562307 RepID=UPI0010BFAD61|nr:hypothetical protein [Rhizobium sp. FKL33]
MNSVGRWMRSWLQMLAALLAIALGSSSGFALAHDIAIPKDKAKGFEIAAIDHGAMIAIAPFRDRILDLARQIPDRNEHLKALLLYNEIQSANCLWELLPGSLTDEASPMNACAHADMASLKAILDELATIDGARKAALGLVGELDQHMVLLGSSYTRCEFSDTVFYTEYQINPNWRDVILYLLNVTPNTLMWIVIASIAVLTLGISKSKAQRRPQV